MEALSNLKQQVNTDICTYTNIASDPTDCLIRECLLSKCDNFRAGNIVHSLDTWKTITSDREILGSVGGLQIEFTEKPVQQSLHNMSYNEGEKQAIDKEINKLLKKQVIMPTGHDKGEIISSIFVRPKKDGSHRLILNLKQLNQFSPKVHFKMDTLRTVIKLVEKDCFMASIDLKDAYYSVRIAKQYRKYLRFVWEGKLYQYTCLPNGLSCAPRKFTKLLKPPLTILHRMGYIAVGYIDDLFLQGDTYNECLSNVTTSFQLFDSLGFVIHPEKSVFRPSQHLVFLGFIIDSVDMTVTLTTEKGADLKALCQSIRDRQKLTIRTTATVIGKIIASFPGVIHGPLYYRALERDKTKALKANRGNFDKPMTLSASAKLELDWWIENVQRSYNPITREEPACTLTTDACNEGWGAVYNDSSTGGLWSTEEKQHHINYLELLAVFLGMKTFLIHEKGKHARLMIDNSTSVAIINNMGTSHSYDLNTLCKIIWEWAISRDLWLSAAHIPGKLNTKADFESRKNRSETEWMLDKIALREALIKLNVTPDVDLFASRLNNQLENYVSYRPDPGASAVDAFSLSWSNLKFYAFPPFSVIPNVLKKIQEDGAKGILVVPDWATQAWYPKAMKLLTQPPVTLKPHRALLWLPNKPRTPHPLWAKLSLLVCHLSGNT
ncbi:MAG: hypothetical protein DSY43_06170 [Gammaproteobacteria bacterium]|nr:MAG: hypothetical protein DSY43_06170 [Gammaproteobacteria bacterium]